jgi:hypothetical protein
LLTDEFIAEGLCGLGREFFWLKASMFGGRQAVPLFNYTLEFALQLRKSTEKPVSVAQYTAR